MRFHVVSDAIVPATSVDAPALVTVQDRAAFARKISSSRLASNEAVEPRVKAATNLTLAPSVPVQSAGSDYQELDDCPKDLVAKAVNKTATKSRTAPTGNRKIPNPGSAS